MSDIPVTDTIHAPFGHVEPVERPAPDDPAMSDVSRAANQLAVCTYLITAPAYHPGWDQYVLSVVNLADHPDLPAATFQFEGATHELILLAIDPRGGCQTVSTMREHLRFGTLPHLTPVNIAEQMIGTDEEAHQLAWLACRAIVHGQLNPETSNGPETIRNHWRVAMRNTLVHLRGGQCGGQS